MISKRIDELCNEYWKIENYEKALNSEEMWDCHHRIEVSEDGLHTIYSKMQLIELGMYFNRCPEELIFLTKLEHKKLHNSTIEFKTNLIGKHHYEGVKNPFFGKQHTDITKNKIKQTVSKLNKGAVNRNKLFKWLDPQGEIHYMASGHVHRWHPDWKKIEED